MSAATDYTPEVTYRGMFDMQVCVPAGWSDADVLHFAERERMADTMNGWFIRREGDEALRGDRERVPCSKREGFVHIMLDL